MWHKKAEHRSAFLSLQQRKIYAALLTNSRNTYGKIPPCK
jgi:hypothetical protein